MGALSWARTWTHWQTRYSEQEPLSSKVPNDLQEGAVLPPALVELHISIVARARKLSNYELINASLVRASWMLAFILCYVAPFCPVACHSVLLPCPAGWMIDVF